MADHIDLTKDSDDEGQNTFESDAALARRLSAELNGEAPKNNKRTIDLTADSQEEAPPAQRARTSQEYSTTARATPRQRPSISTMRAAITQAGLATADLLERADTEARYEQALDRLAERARLDAEREARDRARGVTVAPTAPDGSRQLFFVVERRGDRLAAHWNDGAERPPRAGLTRHWRGSPRLVSLRTHPKAPATKARVLLAYDGDARRGAAWQRPRPMAYRQSGARYANLQSLAKSQMQKCVRRMNAEIAVRAAHELLSSPSKGSKGGLFHLLRRLLVCSCEDSTPLREINSVLVWLFAAACSEDSAANYVPTEHDIAFILGSVAAVASCPQGPSKNPLKKEMEAGNYLAEVPLADVWFSV